VEVSKGGLSEYARQIGKTQPYLSQLIAAAEVLEAVKSITQVMDLLTKTQHLAAIHSAPSRAWPILVRLRTRFPAETVASGRFRATSDVPLKTTRSQTAARA